MAEGPGPSNKRQKTLGNFFGFTYDTPDPVEEPKRDFRSSWLKDPTVGEHYEYDPVSETVICT